MTATSSKIMLLTDRFNRTATDLRVSVTDRCNLRCTYCMPAEGMPWLPHDELLTDDELIRLIRLSVQRLGITRVRFTGGEPLVRPSLENIIAATAVMQTCEGRVPDISLTTNGIGLAYRAETLVKAGLRRVNISMDSLDQKRFAQMARRDRLTDVLAGIAASLSAGLAPVKINAVPHPDSYLSDAPELLAFCLERELELRFIEYMPIGALGWEKNGVVTALDLLAALKAAGYQLSADEESRGSAPAERWLVIDSSGRQGKIGIIASVTRPFCANCSRTRLTADGQIRNCLFATRETDLRTPMRQGADDDQLLELWQQEMWRKVAAHGVDGDCFADSERRMSAIGG